MCTTVIFGVLLFIISAATSFPNPVDQVSTSRLKDTAGVTVEARSPQGSWVRDDVNSSRYSEDTSSEAIMFPDQFHEKGVDKESIAKRDQFYVKGVDNKHEFYVTGIDKGNTETEHDGPIFKPNIPKKATPECARGSTYCEKIDNYPKEYLEEILQTASKDFGAMFGTDTPPEIQQRIDSSDENPLCPSVEEVVYPKTAKNKENVWLFVVNQGVYTQGVRIEKCLNTHDSQSCRFTEGFPLGYKTYCKQKYIYRKLIALDENGKTVTDTFQLPSCCSCTVVADGLNSRVGLSGRTRPRPRPTTGKPSV